MSDQELQSYSPQGLISQALAQNVPIETLERLMDLQERWQASQSRMMFLEALNKFQSVVPVLTKKKKVAFNTTKYSYTPLSDIVIGIKDAMQQAGLSHRWELEEKEENIICTCIISHFGGHSEKTTMSAKRDSSGNKNEIQSRGSAVTYLQRYTLIGALGISTADEDNDGQNKPQPKKEAIPEPVQINRKDEIEKCTTVNQLNELWKRFTKKGQDDFKIAFTAKKEKLQPKKIDMTNPLDLK